MSDDGAPTREIIQKAIMRPAEDMPVDNLPRQRVDVPEWGCYVYVRALTPAERDVLDQQVA